MSGRREREIHSVVEITSAQLSHFSLVLARVCVPRTFALPFSHSWKSPSTIT